MLIVDDEKMNLFVIESVLKSNFDLDCDQASTGEKALELVSERLKVAKEGLAPMYKLILLDYDLGNGLNGPEVAQAIRSLIDGEQQVV